MTWQIFHAAAQAQHRNRSLEIQLAEAISHNQLLSVKQLLRQGVDPNARLVGHYEEPLIFLCFVKNRFSLPTAEHSVPFRIGYHLSAKFLCLKMLLEHGANPNLVDSHGQTPLDLAILWCLPEVVKLLLLHQADPNNRDRQGRTPLMKAVLWGIEDARPMNRKLETIWHLLDGGADIDAQASDGKSALMLAVGNSRIPIVEFLVHSGASLGITDHQGNQAHDIIERHISKPKRKYLRRILSMSPVNPIKHKYQQFIPEGDRVLSSIINR